MHVRATVKIPMMIFTENLLINLMIVVYHKLQKMLPICFVCDGFYDGFSAIMQSQETNIS